MTIQIRADDGYIITFDNDSMMAGKGKIGWGAISEGVCADGEMTKAEAKNEIISWVEEFLK